LSSASSEEADKQVVAVTGGGGFFGIALNRRLCELGFRVKVIDSFPDGVPARLRTLEGQFPNQLAVVRSDITRKENLSEVFRYADYVAHLAAIANPRVCNSNLNLAYKVNVDGMRNVLDSIPTVRKLLFTSSILVYGDQSELPIKETARVNCSDNYALLKLMGEQLCKLYNNSRGVPYVVVRMAYAYGAWQSYDYVLSALILQALETGKIEVWDPRPIRDFVYVDDAVEAIVRALLSNDTACEVVNIGSGIGINVLELANLISGFLRVPVEDVGRRAPTPVRLIADIGKIYRLTGWKPSTKMEEGLMKTIEWLRTHPPA
jgi:nucleoside-diphosphate-sugar epimerase